MPTILLKKSDTPGSVPGTANLTNLAGGVEVAVNTADKRVYSMTSASAVIELGTNPSSLTCSDVSATVLRAGSATITNLLATTLTVSGGTANGVLFLNGSKVATSGSALQFSGTNLGIGGAADATAILDVYTAGGRLLNRSGSSTGGTSTGVGLTAVNTGATATVDFNYRAANHAFISGAGTATTMILDASGNLGIGTASPGAKLHVLGSNLVGIFAGTNANTVYTEYRYNSTTTSGFIGNGSSILSAAADSDFIVRSEGALKFATNGNNFRAVIDTSGNLGLGVTPSLWRSTEKVIQIGSWMGLFTDSGVTTEVSYNNYINSSNQRIYQNTGYALRYQQYNGIHSWHTAPSGTAGNQITGANAFDQMMTLDASGNLGVGITLPNSRLDVVGGTGIRVNEDGASTKVIQVRSNFAGVGPAINVATNDPLLFQTNNTERGRFTAGGDFLTAGKTTASFTTVGAELLANGQINTATANIDNLNLYNTTAAAYRFYVSPGGTVFATNTTISAISDQRLKENVRDLDVGLDAIMALKPRKFDWKEGKGQDKKDVRGFIAQEFEQVFPDLIDEWKDPAPEGEEPYKSVRQDLIPVLVKAIQELSAKVAALEAK
jgi:hypothetical protein